MAASSGDQQRHRLPDGGDEIEEGEFIVPPSYEYDYMDTDDDDTDSDDEREEDRRPVTAPAPSASSLLGSDRSTVSVNVVNAGPVFEQAAPLRLVRCSECSRGFTSQKALNGHMKVHFLLPGRDMAEEEKAPRVGGGSFQVQVDGHMSVAIVVAQPTIVVAEDPIPMPAATANQTVAGSSSSSSNNTVEQNHGESMDIVVAAANPPSQLVVLHPPPAAPQQDVAVHPPAAPQQAVVPPPAAPQQVAVHPPAAPQQVAVHPPAAPQQVVVHPLAPAPPPAGGNNVGGFACRECGRRFHTHQGLGGHVAGHRNRQEAAARAAAAAGVDQGGALLCRGGANKPPKAHKCGICGRDFPSGVALGGHKRKHYNKPKAADAPVVAPAPAVAEAAPVLTSVRIFGVTIVQPQEAPSDDDESTNSTQG